MPLAATVPNSARPAPPSTGQRDRCDDRADLREQAEHHQDDAAGRDDEPALDPGDRHEADVLREGAGGEAVEQAAGHGAWRGCPPAGRRPPSRSSAGRSTTSPMARMSAVVSIMITSITMIIEMIAAIANWGGPKWNGVDTANPCACPRRLKSALPMAMATSAPTTRPSEDGDAAEEPGQEPVDQQNDH